MFSLIKGKMALILGAAIAAAGVVIKVLLLMNKRKDEKIHTLKRNAEVSKKYHERDIDRVTFNCQQSEKVKSINDESNLDKLDLDREMGDDKKQDDLFNSVTR